MIVSSIYKTDLEYSFQFVLCKLTFVSSISLSLKDLINNDYLPIEIENLFTEGNKLNYCKINLKSLRSLEIETPDNVLFTITCPLPFRELDLSSKLEQGFKIKTTGEKIKDYDLNFISK